MGDVAYHRTWNVFRRRYAHGLCCAVPSDASVPTFLLTGDWTFGFQFTGGDPPVPGFSLQSAEIGARFNGFYLFLGFGGPMPAALGSSFPDSAEIEAEPNGAFAHSPDAETRPA